MALIEGNILSFMFEGVRRGDEDKLKAALNASGEVTLKLVKNESPNLFRSIFHFELVPKYIPQEATPEEPPTDWAVHDIPELIVEKAPEPEEAPRFDGFFQVVEPSAPPEEDAADDIKIVEGEELVGETEAVKFPDKEEETIVEKIDDAPTVKAPKGKKSGK